MVVNIIDDEDELDELFNVVIIWYVHEHILLLFDNDDVDIQLDVIDVIDEIVLLLHLLHIDDEVVDDTLEDLDIIDEVDDEIDTIIERDDELEQYDNDIIDETIVLVIVADDDDEHEVRDLIELIVNADDTDDVEYKVVLIEN